MKVLGICGSPRKGGNTEYLLQLVLESAAAEGAETELICLCDKEISPCRECRVCLDLERCVIEDDMQAIHAKLLEADAIVLGTPVFFNNISGLLKAFMDRTWCIRGRLRNKIGGVVAVGRRYGIEGAITAINAYLLKHEMIVANRGVSGFAYEKGEIVHDQQAIDDARKLGKRIIELGRLLALNRE